MACETLQYVPIPPSFFEVAKAQLEAPKPVREKNDDKSQRFRTWKPDIIPDLQKVLIRLNDWVRGVPRSTLTEEDVMNLDRLLYTAQIGMADPNAKRGRSEVNRGAKNVISENAQLRNDLKRTVSSLKRIEKERNPIPVAVLAPVNVPPVPPTIVAAGLATVPTVPPIVTVTQPGSGVNNTRRSQEVILTSTQENPTILTPVEPASFITGVEEPQLSQTGGIRGVVPNRTVSALVIPSTKPIDRNARPAIQEIVTLPGITPVGAKPPDSRQSRLQELFGIMQSQAWSKKEQLGRLGRPSSDYIEQVLLITKVPQPVLRKEDVEVNGALNVAAGVARIVNIIVNQIYLASTETSVKQVYLHKAYLLAFAAQSLIQISGPHKTSSKEETRRLWRPVDSFGQAEIKKGSFAQFEDLESLLNKNTRGERFSSQDTAELSKCVDQSIQTAIYEYAMLVEVYARSVNWTDERKLLEISKAEVVVKQLLNVQVALSDISSKLVQYE